MEIINKIYNNHNKIKFMDILEKLVLLHKNQKFYQNHQVFILYYYFANLGKRSHTSTRKLSVVELDC